MIIIITGPNKRLAQELFDKKSSENINAASYYLPEKEERFFHEAQLIPFAKKTIIESNGNKVFILLTNSSVILKEINTSIMLYNFSNDELDEYSIDSNELEVYYCDEDVSSLTPSDCGYEYKHIDEYIDYQNEIQERIYWVESL